MQLATIDNQITMTSLELVQFINNQRDVGGSELRHDHFMAKVPKVLGEDTAPKFRDSYKAADGSIRPCYKFPKREACLMAMSYSYDLQAKVFDRMTELEQQQAPKLPQTFAEALRLLADSEEAKEQLALQVEYQRPAVEFVERYTQADTGSKGFRQVCKLLNANESRFREFLFEKKIMYRLNGELIAYQNHIDAGRFEVKTGEADGHAFNRCLFTGKGITWVAGEWGKANLPT